MITYGCIGILFLFVLVRSLIYRSKRKHRLSLEEIDRELLAIVNEGRESS
ncbi:hypothetical protein J2Z69_001831 [Paenibacillus shirakamiensis]|uniref:DUF4083 domain-containing protein n=1 Tax=Paenibacillus shirakamiensis TaxID=1265935 RepID=A0ABS4JIA2_9BACL|nr:hypothetical protein [Paenibacillus shirakamiensis]